jgi:Ca-activated chloride channel family protein
VNAREFKVIIILLLVLITAQVVLAGSVHNTVRQGNKLYDQGHFNEAVKEYDQALIDQPQSLEPKFNKANCYFQIDDLAKAIDLYNEVAAESKDMKLVAKAKYNLGNCYFQQGTKQKDSNLQKAIEDLQTGIVCWRGTLEIDPQNEKAKRNIEVARLIIKDIIDQLNKQKEQQQKQAAKQKKLQDQLKELAEKQKALAKQTQETKNQQEKGQINQQEATENYKKQSQEQSQIKKETEQASQQMQQQEPNKPQPPQMQQAAGELEQAMDKQSDAETKLKASDGTVAKQSQDKAAEHLENALKAMSQENSQGQQQQEQRGQTQQPQEPNQPSEEPQQQNQKEPQKAFAPDTTAQEILDKEQREKKQRQILQKAGYQKVEKDW